ncbi:MAG TPA: hypothetical protein VIY49_16265 [Bryobacteraceae bacterium]
MQSIPGPNEAIRSVADSTLGRDPALGGYRVNAAAAKYSRVLASQMYGEHRCYGYLYGGSGGAYQVIAALQNSGGVWVASQREGDFSTPFARVQNLGRVRVVAKE